LDEFHQLSANVAVMRATNDAAVEAAKRAEEMKDNLAFYRI
jgi:outer membrane murein-binding lipoprotein Lpp